MSGIGGRQRESMDFTSEVGLFKGKVVAVNPTVEQFAEILGRTIEEDSKAADYLGEKEGNTTLRIDFWLEVIKDDKKKEADEKPSYKKVSFFLEDKERMNREGTKNQYINEVGSCSWGETEDSLPEWFRKREFRQAYVGEEELYNFMRTWLCELDYRHPETTLQLNWKKLMKGDVKEIKELIGGSWTGKVGCLATIVTKEIEGEIKEFPNVYNKLFLPEYALRHFNLIDYSDESILEDLRAKAPKDLKVYEKFAVNVSGEHGCKSFYKLKPLAEYDPSENLAASGSSKGGEDIDSDGPGY